MQFRKTPFIEPDVSAKLVIEFLPPELSALSGSNLKRLTFHKSQLRWLVTLLKLKTITTFMGRAAIACSGFLKREPGEGLTLEEL